MQDKKNRRKIISEFNIRLLKSYLYIVITFLSIFIINFTFEIFTKLHFNCLIRDFSINVFFFIEDSVFKFSIELLIILCTIIILLFFSKILIINFLFCVSKYIFLSYIIYFLYKICILCVNSFYTPNDYFTIFSLVISMLSAVVAALTIMFGNFKICGIGSNTILKHIFGKQFLYCRAVIFISPLVMLVLIFGGFKYSYFVLFVLSIISLIYLLHLCISVFVDIGIRTNVIPEYISDEIFDALKKGSSISESGKYLYGEFIHSFNNDEFNNFSEVYINLFINIINKCKSEVLEKNKFKIVYIFLNDTKKYLLRNSFDKDDVIKYYFELCLLLVKSTELDEIIYLALFQNVVECSDIKGISTSNKCSEIDRFFEKIFCNLDDYFDVIKFSILLLFQIEMYISVDCVHELSNVIYNRIEGIVEKVIFDKDCEQYLYQNSIEQRERIISIFHDLNRYDDFTKRKNIKHFGQSVSDIINVWNDLCFHVRKMLIFSTQKHTEFVCKLFSSTNNNFMMYKSKTFKIYKLKNRVIGEK